MRLTVPDKSLVLLIGPTGCGKSTFGKTHFLPSQVVSSDFCRGLVSDDESSQEATTDAFDLLYYIVRKRLARGLVTVIDATNVRLEDRKNLLAIAREHHVMSVAIAFNIPERVCLERNSTRPDRQFGPHVVRHHLRSLRQSLRGLQREGFQHVYRFDSEAEVSKVEGIDYVPLWCDKRGEKGPFDIIGDIHGCYDELCELLKALGYQVGEEVLPPEGRRVIFLGDLVDRGPNSPAVLKLVMKMVAEGKALCVPGNHDMKLVRKVRGRDVQMTHGLDLTWEQLSHESAEFREEAANFLDSLVSHLVFDEGNLVAAHAGMKEEMQGRGSARVREFALYGETTGETDEFGLPIRYNWAAEYRGHARVVYGHTPVPEPEWLNRTVNIDTGCVFGGKLSALRYPEGEIFSVPAKKVYAEAARPLTGQVSAVSAQHSYDEALDIEDLLGKRLVHARLKGNITIREENAIAALEAMSRFAANPKWLVYLPPTMSPTETTTREGLLEHPDEAFAYFRDHGATKVVCEEKHMGSRAVAIVCRDREAALKTFGVLEPESGIVYTRTGRRFFDRIEVEEELLGILRRSMDETGFWDRHETDWAVFDCELMPWSAKAQELLRKQYAPVGAVATASLSEAISLLSKGIGAPAATEAEGDNLADLLSRAKERAALTDEYVQEYRRYCWPVGSVQDLRLAPFHLLATEGRVHGDKNHLWHMEEIGKLCAAGGPVLHATPCCLIDVFDDASVAQGVRFWEETTAKGGEGMVVKPLDFVAKGTRGLLQPALKCRGPKYLRIIYGIEYSLPKNIQRLRSRSVGRKRALASQEFALGIEALERFVRKEPLRRTHECVFGVLAMESEPVDPRL